MSIWRFVCLVSLLLVAKGEAQETSAGIEEYQYYDQTADSTTTFSHTVLVFALSASHSTDFSAVSVIFPDASSKVLTDGPFANWYADATPSAPIYGSFTFKTSGGTQGSMSYPIQVDGSIPAPVVFTGDSVEALSSGNTSQPITFSFTAFTPDPNTSYFGLLEIQDVADPDGIVQALLSPSQTQFTIPAGTLQPNTDYSVVISSGEDFGSFSSGYSLVSTNTLDFMTNSLEIPEPSTLAYALFSVLGLVAAHTAQHRAKAKS
jgi:hypothetical protein